MDELYSDSASQAGGVHLIGRWTKEKGDKGVRRKLSLLDKNLPMFCKFHLPGSQVVHS